MKTILRWAAWAGLTLAGWADEGAGPIREQAYVKASNSGMNDQFGWARGSVALAGDTLVVGAPGEDSAAKEVDGDQGDGLDPYPRNPQLGFESGAAYVFSRDGSGWSQQAYLKSTDTAAGDLFGQSVAVSGDTVVVAAPGADGKQAYLKSTDTAAGDLFGQSVAVSGDTVVVAAPGADGKQAGAPFRGAVYVFVREGRTWRQQACLTVPGRPGVDSFGGPVAICGDTLVVGVAGESGAPQAGKDEGELMAGAAYVFVRDGGKWSRQARLEASNARYKGHFGTSVAISGDSLVVGAIGDNSGAGGVNGDPTDNRATGAGAAYVFARDGKKWSQQAYLKAPEPGEFDRFGGSVAISGETAVVGAVSARAGKARPGAKGAGGGGKEDGPGAAFVFVRDGDRWRAQASLSPPEFKGGEGFGSSLAIDGDRVVVGAPLAGDRTEKRREFAGVAYVFVRKAAGWDRGTRIMASNAESGDRFGGAVALSGGTVAVGAAGEDGFARGVNGDQGDGSSGNNASGAAYVFVIPGADDGAKDVADAGDGKGTPEERIFGYWAVDWNAMAKAWQPFVEGSLEMRGIGPGHKDRAAAEKSAVAELKAGFDQASLEIKRGEMVDYLYPGRPERKTYRVLSQDPATGTFELEVTPPGAEAVTLRALVSGDRLTVSGGEDELPMMFQRIDAAAFEKRRRAAAESK